MLIGSSTLALFVGSVLVLLLSPGPNMAFSLAHGITHGARGGLAVALGIFLADLLLTALTATGLTAAVTAWPPFFDLLRYGGAAYLLWLALQGLRAPGRLPMAQASALSSARIMRRACLNSLLNPKALLFFMIFLPQFVEPARGAIAVQLALLGAVLAVVALVFHALLGVFSGRVGAWLQRHAGAGPCSAWLQAGVMLALAVRLLLLERPASA
jgi:threonine/homoserine/homoserine lactone efflux protein